MKSGDKKKIIWIAVIAVFAYWNRDLLFKPVSTKLDADDNAINRAIAKLKLGSVAVKSTPKEVKESVNA